jgi:hypothetical protein
MNVRKLLALAAVAALVVLAAIAVREWRARPEAHGEAALVLPGLRAGLAKVASVTLVGAGERKLVTLENRDGRWHLAERDGYPADGAKVRELLIRLAGLKRLEAKTADPARYAVLGVEDPAGADAKSVRIDIATAAGSIALIAGRRGNGDSSYVRVPGEANALEAGPGVTLEPEPRSWIARALADLAPERVRAIETTRSDGSSWRARREKAGDEFRLDGREKPGTSMAPESLTAAAGAARALEAEDVRTAPTAAPGKLEHASFRSFDGLSLDISGHVEGDAHWIRVQASAEDAATASDAVRAEAARYAALGEGREFKVSGYRYDDLFMTRDRLLKKK